MFTCHVNLLQLSSSVNLEEFPVVVKISLTQTAEIKHETKFNEYIGHYPTLI